MIAAQLLPLGLLAVAALWGEAPAMRHQVLLAVLAVVLLVAGCVPALRRSAWTAAVAGVALATVCWLSAENRTFEPAWIEGYVPLMTPIVVAATAVLAIWGGLVRLNPAGPTRFGRGALVGGALLCVLGVAFYALITYAPVLHGLYTIERYQLEELLAGALLYPLALWLGGTGLRPKGGIALLPLGMAVALLGALVYWRIG